LGKGSLSIRIAEWFLKNKDFELVNIVPVVPEPAWMESLIDWAKRNGISYVDSGDYNDIKNANEKSWEIDLVFSCYYDKKIKSSFISKCGKILNLHNAPLPRYGGILPINWALKNNEKKHGVTIHEITEVLDGGPIISKIEFPIYPSFDEVEDVYKRVIEYAWVLFKETMPILYKIKPEPQDSNQALYYSDKDSNLLGDRFGYNRKSNYTKK